MHHKRTTFVVIIPFLHIRHFVKRIELINILDLKVFILVYYKPKVHIAKVAQVFVD